MAAITSVTLLLAGCSVDDLQQDIADNPSLQHDLTFSWFGRNDDEEGAKDGASPYANDRDYITFNYDLTDVGESKLNELPAYDFSGPKPSGGSGTEATDPSLLSSNQESTESSEENLNVSGKKVYLVPLLCGQNRSGYLARNMQGYQKLQYSSSSRKWSIKEYRNELSRLKSPKSSDGFGYDRFKGASYTHKNSKGKYVTYSQWKIAWNMCYYIGTVLEQDGCTVMYPYTAKSAAGKDDNDPTKFLGSNAGRNLQDIAEDIAKQKPDYVIYIGFNDGDFGAGNSSAKSKNTLFIYENYAKSKSKGFAKSLSKQWNANKDLAKSIPADKQIDINSLPYVKAYPMGAHKAQTALTSLQINKYSGKSAAIMLGNFNTNISSKNSYSYKKQKTLGTVLADVVEKSL